MSYQQLTDETFPTSLLMEFDMLDDEIPISPPRILEVDKTNTANEMLSSEVTSHTSGSNTSSGNYSFSTENENGSGSSSSSNPTTKYRSYTSKRATTTKDSNKIATKTSTKSANHQKKSKSLENLVNKTALLVQNSSTKNPKYSHVKSKVKQFIDETTKKQDRKPFIRHKSMPECSPEHPLEECDEIDPITYSELKIRLKQKTEELNNLQRHLIFNEAQLEDNFSKIGDLKHKIEAMRLENSRREMERQRERELEKERERQLFLEPYLRYSNPTLNKTFASMSTQTSPDTLMVFNISALNSDDDDSFEGLMSASASSGPNVKRTLQFALEQEQNEQHENNTNENVSPDSATHPERSTDYPPMLPSSDLGQSSPRDAENRALSTQDYVQVCNDCASRKEKTKKKKNRLASFFCIKKNNE
ncbi:uncharacterized protein LOC131693039 [Topomyia yanbarensis]|uniref:uncharacterized protein LOC131693039 n=1 Tax=Topomyia yanbarensis TaxID=2498891 RepID=UPI00273BCAFD|nr:uncharacterized protein LOC131693039 [Topomyia yanbarensis]